MPLEKSKIPKLVSRIIDDIKRRGDRALIDMAARFDKVRMTRTSLKVSRAQIYQALVKVDRQTKQALRDCANRIQFFHEQEKKRICHRWNLSNQGVQLGQSFSAMNSVGLYVPGGRFSYPSTVLMSALPAKIAGVKRIVMVTPPARLSDEVLAAASLAGVTEIYRIGGPAALAALALGTKTIRPVDFIVGPGNALVTEAKRQLFGIVGIDLLAGPSELVVVADSTANPAFIAADLAAQTEHDPDSLGVLISLSSKIIRDVKALLPASLRRQCQFLFEPNKNKALVKVEKWAGEHVEIMTADPSWWSARIKNAGTIFEGSYSPAVMGDYWAGPSHVLPTGRSARYASGLSVMTFMKRLGIVRLSQQAFLKGWRSAYQLANVEGLLQHARALKIRMENQ